MIFRDYLRWEGCVLITLGVSLYLLGSVEGHQGHADAAISGLIMIGGTGAFMTYRVAHRAVGGLVELSAD